jgi:F-type H+-transporting ATPase subunit epsilon
VSTATTTGLLLLKVLTPEGSVLEGDVSEVTLPGSEGELGVLPAHAALLTKIIPGALAYRAPDGQGTIAVARGVAEVRDDRVIVLVERAVPAEDIDAAALEASRKKLIAEREIGAINEARLAAIEDELLLIEVQLRIARPGTAEAAH